MISLRVTVIIRLLRCHCEEFWQADSIAAAAGSISLIRIRRQRLMISLVQIILVIDSGRQELSHQLQAETASGEPEITASDSDISCNDYLCRRYPKNITEKISLERYPRDISSYPWTTTLPASGQIFLVGRSFFS